jgi:pimeloyl-ACP methyl ester carboxylesterase
MFNAALRGHVLLISMFTMILAFFPGCKPIPIDPTDPLENAGAYTVLRSPLLITNSEQPAQQIQGSLYRPDTPAVTSGKAHLVLLLPGFGASYQLYSAYADHLASHGYWVVGMDFVKPANAYDAEHDYQARQVSMAIDYLAVQPQYANELDTANAAIIGHSRGGKIAFYTASQDARVKAVVALDPVNGGGPPCFIAPNDCAKYPVAPNPARGQVGLLDNVHVASVILRSQPDATFNPENEFNASGFYFGSDGAGLHAVPSPAVYFDMGAVGHADYLTLLQSDTVQIVKRTALAFLTQQFDGVDASAYFSGARIDADIAAGRIISVERR